jgi:hypothetical protein
MGPAAYSPAAAVPAAASVLGCDYTVPGGGQRDDEASGTSGSGSCSVARGGRVANLALDGDAAASRLMPAAWPR